MQGSPGRPLGGGVSIIIKSLGIAQPVRPRLARVVVSVSLQCRDFCFFFVCAAFTVRHHAARVICQHKAILLLMLCQILGLLCYCLLCVLAFQGLRQHQLCLHILRAGLSRVPDWDQEGGETVTSAPVGITGVGILVPQL